ncbi:hypothetical protein ACIQTZ_22315, partial [Paenarthrobacter sp. NPDC090520]|uniref:hypothetical protein n=1 Tax=Paenarthrobacter sp. NPDC090520 TaxID=3364382 RepID=UPI00382AA1F8
GPDTSGAAETSASPAPAAEHAPPTASPAKPPGPPGTYDQRLGDQTLPGRHPDLQPTIGDTDGGPGTWQEPPGRSPNGAPDQTFATGVTATGPKGNALEYVTDYITAAGEKKSIAFDGHLWRGRPPIQIFQEIKGNYDLVYRGLFEGFHGKAAIQKAINKWADQTLIKQIEALEGRAPGSRLEWIFTHNRELSEMMEDAVDAYLESHPDCTVSIDVKFIPLER